MGSRNHLINSYLIELQEKYDRLNCGDDDSTPGCNCISQSLDAARYIDDEVGKYNELTSAYNIWHNARSDEEVRLKNYATEEYGELRSYWKEPNLDSLKLQDGLRWKRCTEPLSCDEDLCKNGNADRGGVNLPEERSGTTSWTTTNEIDFSKKLWWYPDDYPDRAIPCYKTKCKCIPRDNTRIANFFLDNHNRYNPQSKCINIPDDDVVCSNGNPNSTLDASNIDNGIKGTLDTGCINNITKEDAISRCRNAAYCQGFYRSNQGDGAARTCFKRNITNVSEVSAPNLDNTSSSFCYLKNRFQDQCSTSDWKALWEWDTNVAPDGQPAVYMNERTASDMASFTHIPSAPSIVPIRPTFACCDNSITIGEGASIDASFSDWKQSCDIGINNSISSGSDPIHTNSHNSHNSHNNNNNDDDDDLSLTLNEFLKRAKVIIKDKGNNNKFSNIKTMFTDHLSTGGKAIIIAFLIFVMILLMVFVVAFILLLS